VFQSIHEADPDPKLLAYQYLQTLPQIAQGDANKLWIVPSEFGKALEGLARMTGGTNGDSAEQPPAWLAAAATSAAAGTGEGSRGDGEKLDTTDWVDGKSTEAQVPPEATSSTEPGIGSARLPDTRTVARSAVEQPRSAPPTQQMPPVPPSYRQPWTES